jgi:AraC-like DNA-binding protein
MLKIDGVPVTLLQHQIIVLTPIQHIQVDIANEAIVYQFNRAFYCIKDHDKEVSCNGLLFFGNCTNPIITLDTKEQGKFSTLHQNFLEEIDTKDTIQAEMLRILLARLIIKITRLFKLTAPEEKPTQGAVNLLRSFNILVEEYFKEAHRVSFYADKLFKAPKTLANNFAKYNKSPLQIIHDRIVLEAKRQLRYTNKTTKQIAFDIGFEDPSHLSRMFKKQTGISPLTYKKIINR